MAFGLNITNANGRPIASTDYAASYAISQSGSVTVAPGATVVIAPTAFADLIFLRIAQAAPRIAVLQDFAGATVKGHPSNAANATVAWYSLLDTADLTGSGAGVGLRIQGGSSGSWAEFDTTLKYPRVREAVSVPAPTAVATSTAIAAVPSGLKPYWLANFCTGAFGVWDDTASSGLFKYNGCYIRQPDSLSIETLLGDVGVTATGATGVQTLTRAFRILVGDVP